MLGWPLRISSAVDFWNSYLWLYEWSWVERCSSCLFQIRVCNQLLQEWGAIAQYFWGQQVKYKEFSQDSGIRAWSFTWSQTESPKPCQSSYPPVLPSTNRSFKLLPESYNYLHIYFKGIYLLDKMHVEIFTDGINICFRNYAWRRKEV